MASCDEMLPFYGPVQGVVPSSDDLLPPALVKEIEKWTPVPGVDINSADGKTMRNDKFEEACQTLFQPNRFYVNMQQLEQVAHSLVSLWGKESEGSKRKAVLINKHKVTIQCSFVVWQMHLVPVKGKGKGEAYRIMTGLDLEEPGLQVIKIRDSKGHKQSNPWYPATPKSEKVPIKSEKDQPYGPSDAELSDETEKSGKQSPRSVSPTEHDGKKDIRKPNKPREPTGGQKKDTGQSQGLDRKPPGQGKRGSSSASSPFFREPSHTNDVVIISKDGDRIPAQKSVLAAASPTLKQIFEFGGALSVLKWPDYPTRVVRAAIEFTTASSSNPVDGEVVATLRSDLELCMRLASEYELVKFQRLGHQALQNRLSIGNLKTALLEAQKTNDQTLKQGCFKFIQQHAHAVLTDKNIVRLAIDMPELWDELVRALLDSTGPAESRQAATREQSGTETTSQSGHATSNERQAEPSRGETSKRSRNELSSPVPRGKGNEHSTSNKRRRSRNEEEKAWNLEGRPTQDEERIVCNTELLSRSPVDGLVGKNYN
ncbi:expressed unknown protein [Seminavis robusta]|uniref:BTB domain-containing protein n=1 Tax=Seminavis robusta TaxID=568900 RepID=A0A9N8I0W8_9STRA|nr:expressed unknown protein [Seminavis robusta]|eukprot:Sro2925_g340370.1 n/a (542) ;mRNA; r:5550-7175